MSLPVDNTIVMPSAVQFWPNGRIPDTALVTAAAFNGGPDMVLCSMAMRAFLAYAGACHAATGVALRTTSKADSYRWYAVQEAVFRTRYTDAGPTPIDRVGVWWPGHGRWYHRSGAQAAVPGTSNHGKAIAVDWANYGPALEWMKANAAAYGISWELQSEAWHQRYNDGDQLPAAVLKWEAQPTVIYLQLTDQNLAIVMSDGIHRRPFPGNGAAFNAVRAAIPGPVIAINSADLPNWGDDIHTDLAKHATRDDNAHADQANEHADISAQIAAITPIPTGELAVTGTLTLAPPE